MADISMIELDYNPDFTFWVIDGNFVSADPGGDKIVDITTREIVVIAKNTDSSLHSVRIESFDPPGLEPVGTDFAVQDVSLDPDELAAIWLDVRRDRPMFDGAGQISLKYPDGATGVEILPIGRNKR